MFFCFKYRREHGARLIVTFKCNQEEMKKEESFYRVEGKDLKTGINGD